MVTNKIGLKNQTYSIVRNVFCFLRMFIRKGKIMFDYKINGFDFALIKEDLN